jgi:CHAT domain
VYDYNELRIRIERSGAGGFKAYATGPSGETSGDFTLPFSELELENMLLRISSHVARGVRRVETPESSLVTAFGGKLFEALFIGRIRDLYHDSLAGARAQGKGLRITLALTDVPELMQLPWEFLYDDPDFLSMSVWTPVVRYLDLPRSRDPLSIEPPLRILAMVSSPTEAADLDVERERSKLEEALAGLVEAGTVEIDWLETATLRELQRHLQGPPYHIFHYIGHGAFDPQLDDGVLLLEDAQGNGDRVSGVKLGTILSDHTSLRLAVLNSCEGGRTAAEDPFSGVASSLVQKQIPAVLAMQFEITDKAAILFAEEFYAALAASYPVDSALAEGRKAIYSAGNDLEWGTPVLLLRVRDGRIFDIPPALRAPKKRRPPATRKKRAAGGESGRRRAAAKVGGGRWRWAAIGVGILALAGIAAGLAVWLGGGGSKSGGWSRVDAGSSALDGSGRQEMRSVAALSGGNAIAVGRDGSTPAIWTYDGSSWSRQEITGQRGVATGVARGLAASLGTVVAVGSSSPAREAVIWSRSGQGQWQRVCCAGAAGLQVAYAVLARRNGTFVAVGAETNAGDKSFDAAVWLSPDGQSWRQVPDHPDLGGPASQVMKGVIEVGDRLYAVGRDGKDAAAWSSTNGEDWAKEKAPALKAQVGFQEISAAAHVGSRLVGVGWTGQPDMAKAAVWIRFDRTGRWESVELPGPDFTARGQQMLDLVAAPPELVAVGYDHRGQRSIAAVWSSADSKTWRPVHSSAFESRGDSGMASIALLGGKTPLAVGNAGSKQDADAAIWESRAGQ